jgi:hypothetical protein
MMLIAAVPDVDRARSFEERDRFVEDLVATLLHE